MNKIYILLLLLIVSISCTDLDTFDRTILSQDIALDNVAGFESVLFSAYESVNDFDYYGQQQTIEGDVLADNLNLIQLSGRYEGEFVNEIGAHYDFWLVYELINDANVIIGLIDDESVDGEQEEKNKLKGEAYFLRALAHHDLLRSYAYEPNQIKNGWDQGVVLRTEPVEGLSNVTDIPRASVQEGYDLVIDDLLEAISLLPSQTDVEGQDNRTFRATKEAAHALLARVYLYSGDYSLAATQADLALATTTAILTDTTGDQYQLSWSETPHPESLFESDIRTADWNQVDGLNESLHSLTYNALNGAQFIIGASPGLIDEIETEAEDVRRELYTEVDLGFRMEKWLGEKGNFLENIPIIRYSEVLLIAAEAKARSGQTPEAQADITKLRNARGISGTVTAAGDALINLIMKERRIELAGEGHRFYDLKRLGLPITKSEFAEQLGAQTLQPDNFKVLARIPLSEVELSDGILEQNPGY